MCFSFGEKLTFNIFDYNFFLILLFLLKLHMDKKKWFLLIVIVIVFPIRGFGQLTVTTATGGTNISADKAANASSPEWTTLGNIVLAENNNGDFPESFTSFVINAPNGWAFNTTSVSATVSGGAGQQNLTVNSVSVNSSSITIYVSIDKTNKTDILTITGIQVRATDGASTPSNGNLTWGSSWLNPLWNGYPLGELSQAPGAVENFMVENELGGNIGTQNATEPFNIKITARDQFNNLCNYGSNTFTGTASITSTGILSSGAATGNFSNGEIIHSVTISNGGNFNITATNGAVTGSSNTFLVNNPPPTVSMSTNTTSITENGGVATITFTLSNTYHNNVGVNIDQTGGTATEGNDYIFADYYVVISPGNLTATTTITASDDTNYEGDETLVVEITNVDEGNEDGNQNVTITIIDDELPPPSVSLSIDKATIPENGGVATITITLSNTYGQTVGVNLSPSGTAGNGSDYSISGYDYVEIAPGNLTTTALITAQNDFISDPYETVIISISNVNNGIEDGNQTVSTTIVDDDTPGITIAPLSGHVTTENGGTANFEVVLNTQPTDNVELTLYSNDTSEGTISTSSLTFTPTNWNTPKTITITGVPDYIVDGDINYSVITNAATSNDNDYNGFNPSDVSVTNIDDRMSPSVSFTSSNQSSSTENGTLTITAELNMVLGTNVSIPFSVNGLSTATGSGIDYSITSSPIIITAGDTTSNIIITITDDALYENNETIIIDMGTPTNAAQGAIIQHTATINNDDPLPSVAFRSASQSSTDESGTLTINVDLSNPSALDISIPFSINSSSTATGNGTDYNISTSPLTILAGNSSNTITINIIDDSDTEGDETIIIDMGTPTNATKGGVTSHTATILDDDLPAQLLGVSDNNICLNDPLTFTATLNGINCNEIVRYEAINGEDTITIINNPGSTCSEQYIPQQPGVYYYRYYYYKNKPKSGFSNIVAVTVNPLPTTPTALVSRNNICSNDEGNISLSVSGGTGNTVRWYTESCEGNDIGTGNPLVIPSPETSTTYFVRYENECGNSDCSQVTLTVYPSSIIDNPGDQESCGNYTLPPITGTGLSGNEAYYTSSNGLGTEYNAGDIITNSSTIYIYDDHPYCPAEVSFYVNINRFNLEVSPNGIVNCPDLLNTSNPAFDPNNDSYNAGASIITFHIEPDSRYNYHSDWYFSFEINGLVLTPDTSSVITELTISGDDATLPTQTSGNNTLGTINAGNNNYVDLTFQVVNTPGSRQMIEFLITNATDGNTCNETESIDDNSATYTLEIMPNVGRF